MNCVGCFLCRAVIRLLVNKVRPAISVVCPVALISMFYVMFTAKDSEVVNCGNELTLLLSSFSFGLRECPCSRRLPTVPKLLSKIRMSTRLHGVVVWK